MQITKKYSSAEIEVLKMLNFAAKIIKKKNS